MLSAPLANKQLKNITLLLLTTFSPQNTGISMFHFRVVQHHLFIFQHHLNLHGFTTKSGIFFIRLATFYLETASFLMVNQDKWNMKHIISNIQEKKGARRHNSAIHCKWLISLVAGIHKIRTCSMLQHHLSIFGWGEPWNTTQTVTKWINSSPPGQDGCHFGRQQFQMHFHEWTVLYFNSNFTEVCS